MNESTTFRWPQLRERVELIIDGWPRFGTKITRIVPKDRSAPTAIPCGTRGTVVSLGAEVGVEVEVPGNFTALVSRGQVLKGFVWKGNVFVKAADFWQVFRKLPFSALAKTPNTRS